MGNTYFSLLDHSEMGGKTKDAGRVMFNFETTQVKEEFAKIKAVGAVVVKEPYEMGGGWVATLADPDGNYFQLVTPMPECRSLRWRSAGDNHQEHRHSNSASLSTKSPPLKGGDCVLRGQSPALVCAKIHIP